MLLWPLLHANGRCLMSTNILRGCEAANCAHECWRAGADRGDVRRCEHGKIWTFDRLVEGRFFNTLIRWRRIHPFWEPITYRRAIRALAASEADQ